MSCRSSSVATPHPSPTKRRNLGKPATASQAPGSSENSTKLRSRTSNLGKSAAKPSREVSGFMLRFRYRSHNGPPRASMVSNWFSERSAATSCLLWLSVGLSEVKSAFLARRALGATGSADTSVTSQSSSLIRASAFSSLTLAQGSSTSPRSTFSGFAGFKEEDAAGPVVSSTGTGVASSLPEAPSRSSSAGLSSALESAS
mmetsp:Transcript_5864/g.13486  ORF Transcript_5864/g.13486 Transcript_5864/m.13486 type:complete len:201 (+) Transcript_5864:322-924(+)